MVKERSTQNDEPCRDMGEVEGEEVKVDGLG